MKRNLLLSSIAFFTGILSITAQDDCNTAVSATVSSSCVSTTFNLPGTLTQSTPAPTLCGTNPLKDDAWLVFTAIASSTTVSYTNTTRDASIWIYSGACGSLTQIGCADAIAGTGTESITFATVAGTTYHVRIGRMLGNNTANMAGSYCIYSPNDNCASASAITPASSCVYTNGDLSGATASAGAPNPSCSPTSADDDVWFSFVASATSHPISVQASASLDVGFQVLSGACGSQTEINCTNAGGTGITESATVSGLTIGNTYYVRIFSIGTSVPTTTTFGVCVSGAPSGLTCPASLGTAGVDVFNAGTLSSNYTASGQSTCGHGDNIKSTNVTSVCGSTLYYGGLDDVYYFTPSSSGQSTISITSTGSYTGLMLYDGCPFTTGSSCVGTDQDYTGSKSMCVTLTAGHTYYLVIDSWPAPTCNPYNLTITAPVGIPAGTTCSNAVSMTLPYSATGQTTACFGNDYTNASTGSCGTLYESGEDKVYTFTTTGADCIGITLTNASTTSIGYQVYQGCPGSAGTVCIGNNGGASSGTLSGSVTVPGAGTYYLVIDTWSTPFNCNYDIAVSSLGSGQSNDLPCNASILALGSYASGDNNCSSGTGEPATPACWSSGSLNTVWYSVVCPASGSLKIKTLPGTLTNTQIAVYSGPCSALTYVNCNDDMASCGGSYSYASELSLTGLTVGATYYIRVDGYSNLTGTFSLLAIDGSSTYPPLAGQDCSNPNPVCTQSFQVADPGYSGFGNTCDLPSTYCLASAERNVVWYTIPINANGTFVFDLVPNDFNSTIPDETDYDFAVWRINGAGAVTCAQIAAGTAIPIDCNYSGLGITGVNTAGNANTSLSASVCPMSPGYNASPTYDGAYELPIAVSTNDVLLLAISNFASSTSGFRIDFRTSPIGYTSATATSVTWSGGGNSSSWTNSANWGGCNVPACGRSAVIAPFAIQPTITANAQVNDLTIQAGATLTIAAGVTVDICGNFTNSGNLVMQAGSTITFTNGTTHNISGNFTGSNKIWNLTITQSSGVVNLNTDMDLGGNFTTSNSTSVFNSNGHYITIAGNFVNATGATTFTNVGTTGTLEFNGTSAQTYNQGTSTLTLNNVLMNHTGTGVTIQTNMVLGTSGILTLTQGKIITNANEVQVTNTASAACTAGNTTSFVQGNLRRYLNGAATSYNFPVGEATKGYQRANISFTTATGITQLLAFFSTWSPITVGPSASDCPNNTYNVLNALDNGYWTIAQTGANNGTYDCSLYSTNYTNSGGAAGWTVMKKDAAAWFLQGTCVGTSTAALTQRTGMSGFSQFAVAQTVSPLPIELLSFTGTTEADFNHLSWVTASETNNNYFSLERSDDGVTFTEICRVNGYGTTSTQHSYSCDDNSPAEGMNYYRLKQVDYNGQFTYSSIVSLEFHRGMMTVTNIHPNPTSGDMNFDFNSPEEAVIHVVVMDVRGRVVYDKYEQVKAGTTQLKTILENEDPGIYSLRITEDKHAFFHVERIIKY